VSCPDFFSIKFHIWLAEVVELIAFNSATRSKPIYVNPSCRLLAHRKDVNVRTGHNQYHLYVHRIRFSVAETTVMLSQYSIYSGFCRKIFNLMNIFMVKILARRKKLWRVSSSREKSVTRDVMYTETEMPYRPQAIDRCFRNGNQLEGDCLQG